MADFNEVIHPNVEIKDTFKVDNEEKADWAIGKAVEAQEAIDMFTSTKKLYIERINSWYDKVIKSHEATIEYMEMQVRPWAEDAIGAGKKRSVSLPSGTAGLRKSPLSIIIDDESRVLKDCTKLHPEIVKKSVPVSAIKDILKTSGMLVDGCSIKETTESFYIKGAKGE